MSADGVWILRVGKLKSWRAGDAWGCKTPYELSLCTWIRSFVWHLDAV